MTELSLCTKCIEGRDHPWHDNGDWAGDLPEDAQPPIQDSRGFTYAGWYYDDRNTATPRSELVAPTPLEVIEQAKSLVYGERQADYGHPADDYGRTAALWSALLGIEVTAKQAALCMVLVKLSREMNRPKPDNLVDAHGYLMVAGRIKERELGRE